MLLRVYKALIRPILEYGAEAFDSASMAVKNKLNSIKYQALKICVGAVSRTSLEKLQVECGVPPLALRRTYLSKIYAQVVVNTDHHPNDYLMEDNWQRHYFHDGWSSGHNIPFNVRCLSMEVGRNILYKSNICFPYWYIPRLDVNTTIHPLVQGLNEPYEKREAALQIIHGKWKYSLHIYTDGSVDTSRNRVGCGCYVPEFKYKGVYRLLDTLSIFSAELMAIFLALLWVSDVEPREVCILSDSLKKHNMICLPNKIRLNLINTFVMSRNKHISKKTPCFSRKRSKK